VGGSIARVVLALRPAAEEDECEIVRLGGLSAAAALLVDQPQIQRGHELDGYTQLADLPRLMANDLCLGVHLDRLTGGRL